MRIPIFLTLFALGLTPPAAFSQQQSPAVRQLTVRAGTPLPELVCERKPNVVRPPAEPNPDPMEIPSEDLLEATAPDLPARAALPRPTAGVVPLLGPRAATPGFQIAVWGDSHLAANFFTEELAKQLKVPPEATLNALIPANMGKGGVRLPLRQSCVSPQWKYELAYLGGDAAAAPGPGLVNLYSEQAGATLAWDVRKDAQAPGYQRVRLLYQQTEAPMLIALSIDDGPEQEVTLHEAAGPAVLELLAERPLTHVKLRLIDARLRFHGLELLAPQPAPYVLDVFGYPGATVASWKAANLPYLASWFGQRPYQLVILEFGTNEGNNKPFDLAAYRQLLTASVQNMKTIFPDAACVLIAPGDRGILVRRSANGRKKSRPAAHAHAQGKQPRSKQEAAAGKRKRNAAPAADLFVYSKIHAAIGQAQAEIATAAGCTAWSMQDAMGGPGQAYAWAQATPALMSRDLIHFTVAGYRRLAQKFAQDMGWSETPLP
ncbi:MAG: GDSL-type esterase/lipase family protein [Sphingomonadaceae bacterium]